ncbi:MAG: adenylyltransferase/cytidyltransferase family protein [Atribacterota bacterium]
MKKYKIIFTAGTWDLFHTGHLNILKKAKKLGDKLIVGVSTNKLVKRYKKCNPILNYKQRFAIIKELKCVDKVIKQTNIFDVKQFKKLKADIFVIGDDWKGREHLQKGLKWLKNNNYIYYIPYTKGLSTSMIKEKIIRNSYNIIKAQTSRSK